MQSRRGSGIPFLADDLRALADQVEAVTAFLGDDPLPEGDWRWGVRVELFDEMDWLLGEVRPQGDGWFGFYPEGW